MVAALFHLWRGHLLVILAIAQPARLILGRLVARALGLGGDLHEEEPGRKDERKEDGRDDDDGENAVVDDESALLLAAHLCLDVVEITKRGILEADATWQR